MLAALQQALAKAAACRIRLPVILQGDEKSLLAQAQHLLMALQPAHSWWLGANTPAQCQNIGQYKAHQLLGIECDCLIINAFSGFDADKIAASAGALTAGGLWLLLAPESLQWKQLANPAHHRLRSYPTPTDYPGYFIAFWLGQLQQANVLRGNATTLFNDLTWPKAEATSATLDVTMPYKTSEQATAVSAILNVVSGHRRRPLLLLADRGCGKSAALGIAAAHLALSGKKHILITAPAKAQAAVALAHFAQLTEHEASASSALRFVAVDELLASQPEAELLLIDEAAAIPTPLLQQLLNHYSRIVFASTEHGYEGTGRGFQLRFQPYLTKRCPNWRLLRLTQPIRYQAQDPLEQIIRSSFLLKQTDETAVTLTAESLELKHYHASDWLTEPKKLQQVFGLLSFAHYQTQVKDLAALLDNPALSVYTLEQDKQLLACALISQEGEIDDALSQAIYKGERRIQGHLLAQNLAFHLASPALATVKLARIMRIAVQPHLQRQQLGSQLLTRLEKPLQQQGYHYVGSSFAASADLVRFWQKAGFAAIRLGMQLDKASAEPSLVMLKALSAENVSKVQQLKLEFASRLYQELPDYPSNIASDLLLQLIQPTQHAMTPLTLTNLQLFSADQRPFELVISELLQWFNQYAVVLSKLQQQVFIAKLWQKQSWAVVCQRFSLSGKACAIKLMQQAIIQHIDSA